MIKIAVLDDEKGYREKIKSLFDSYNKKQKYDHEKVRVDLYSDPKSFLDEFDHDLAIIDRNLKGCSIQGDEVSEKTLEEHWGSVVIQISSKIPHGMNLMSFLDKSNLRAAEIMQRYFKLKRDPDTNITQICVRNSELSRIFAVG